MAQKLKGVGGVLGGLISPEPSETASVVTPEPIEQPATLPSSAEATKLKRPVAKGTSRSARRGRPPGPKTGESSAKEKVSLRIDKDLMDEYRDWSWEERCQLGELVERALTRYLKHRPRPQGE